MPRPVTGSVGWVGGAWGTQRRGLVSLIPPPQVPERSGRRERQQPWDAPRRRRGNAPAAQPTTQTRAGNEVAATGYFWTISPAASGRQARHPARKAMWSHQAEDASAEEGAETDVVAGAEGTLAEEEMMTGTETAIQATGAHIRQRPQAARENLPRRTHGTEAATILQVGCGSSWTKFHYGKCLLRT